MGVPNVLVSIGYAPNDETLNRLHSVKPKYLAERRFYACRQQDDFLKYVNKGIDAGDYLGYAGNPEKSSGIFDARGLMKKSQSRNCVHYFVPRTAIFGTQSLVLRRISGINT